jgi:hypothetical protein
MRRRGLPLLVLLAAAGCAEMARPPPPPPPAGLVGVAPDPLRAALSATAAAFAEAGAGLAGRPAEAAQAVAQLEYLAATLPEEPRHRFVAERAGQDLLLARQEVRDALGVAEAAQPMAVVRALLDAAAALRAGDGAAAARALPAPMFLPGGEASVRRLGLLGPLPQAELATAAAAQALARADALGLADRARLPEATLGLGTVTTAPAGLGY